MNIPIDEQIARQRAVIRHCEGKSGINIDGDKAILASLEKLAALESQPVPVEPDVLRLRNGFFCEPDGSHSPTYGKYVRKNDYDSLQSALKLAQEERDKLREQVSVKADLILIADKQKWDAEGKLAGIADTIAAVRRNINPFDDPQLDYLGDMREEIWEIQFSADRRKNERAEKAEAVNRRMVELMKRLSFLAQTTGGTAGRDDELVKAIDESAELLKEVEK